jgi:hypothetical protein
MDPKIGTLVRYVDESGAVFPGMIYDFVGASPHIVYFNMERGWQTTAAVSVRDDANSTPRSWSVV